MWEMSVKEKSKQAEKPERAGKLGLKEAGREIVQKQRGLLMAMIGLAVLSLVLLVIALVTLRPQESLVFRGYGDVYGEFAGLTGGYRRASWLNMLAFPILALLFGVAAVQVRGGAAQRRRKERRRPRLFPRGGRV